MELVEIAPECLEGFLEYIYANNNMERNYQNMSIIMTISLKFIVLIVANVIDIEKFKLSLICLFENGWW